MPVINVRLTQLYSLRAQVDALIALEEVAVQAVQEALGCQHPEERRQSVATFGNPKRFKCLACGETLESA